MAEVLRFESEFPLRKEVLETVCREVLRTRAPSGPMLALSALAYLLRFSAKENSLHQNYTLTIAKPNDSTEDSDTLWTKDQVWVVLKLKGGTGPRVNYMITALGVARVNWKTGTRTFLGAMFPILDAETRYAQGKLFEGFGDEKEHAEAVYTRAPSLERQSSATSLFGNILSMSPAHVQSLLENPQQLKDTATGLFSLFDEDHSGSIDSSEFLNFFMRFLQQPVEVSMAVFQQKAQGSSALSAEAFEALFRWFLNAWLQEKGLKPIVFMWNVIVQLMSDLPEEKREGFFDEADVKGFLGFVLERLEASQGLSFDVFHLLEDGYDLAMYWPKKPELKIRKAFDSLAVNGVIPVSVYFTHIRAYFSSIASFLSQWNSLTSLYDSIPCDSPEALLTVSRQRAEGMFEALNLGEKMKAEEYTCFTRCCYIVPENTDIPDEIVEEMELPLILAKNDFLKDAEKKALEDIKCANTFVYKTIAKLSPKRLTALSIEEYRLKRIAKDQFSLTFPIRTHHDWDTFRSYGQLLCEVFQVENADETLQTLYSNLAESEGLTETGFVQVLKQMIGYQMKLAQSRAMSEEKAMEGVRLLLANESALQEFVQQQFTAIDLDHDGLISPQEAKLLLKGMDTGRKEEDSAELVMVVMDRDKDGKVSFEDYSWFIKAWLRHAANQ